MRIRDLVDDHFRASRGFWRIAAWFVLILGIAMVVSGLVIAVLEVIAWTNGTSIWTSGRIRRRWTPMGVAIMFILIGVAMFRIGRDEFDGLDEYDPPAKNLKQ